LVLGNLTTESTHIVGQYRIGEIVYTKVNPSSIRIVECQLI